MKHIKYIVLLICSVSTLISCIDDDNDELTGDAKTGGLISLNNAAIGYVIASESTYTASGNIFQGTVQTTTVDVYKSFTDAVTGKTSEEVFLTSIPVTTTEVGKNATFEFSFTYEDLIEGLTLDGNPLPSSDSGLNIGDSWSLRYAAKTSDGDLSFNSNTTKVSVGTRFAGIYRTIDASYYRIGVLTSTTSDWPEEIIIESVDADTYRVVNYFGNFDGNEWYFKIDEATGKISYPDETPSGDAQLGNGQPFISCASSPNDMTNVPCGDVTDRIELDEVNGADKLYMSFGYFTSGSGPREFYQVLEKIVD